ncbi:MAG: DHH family phosphoesterase [Bacteriovoracaceae bacterium]
MKNFKRFKSLIGSVKNIVITTHIFPDADGIGSQLALAEALKKMKKNVSCVNESSLQKRYSYLDPNKKIISCRRYSSKRPIDLLIVVDTNGLERIGSKMSLLARQAKEIFFIDHHPAPKEVLALHIIDVNKAATGEVVGEIIRKLKIPYSPEMALALYTAIMIDTSSFRYPNVKASTHGLISKLLETGIKSHKAYDKIYGAKELSHLQLVGQVLLSAQSTENQSIAWIYLTEKMMKKYRVEPEETHSFINYLLILKGIKVAVMFREEGKRVKISLRSSSVDVGVIAQSLGGGGHNHSAATYKEGPLTLVIKQTIDKIKIMTK